MMRKFRDLALSLVIAAASCAALATAADAATKKPQPYDVQRPTVVQRSASGTVIQPTTTIIHDGAGHTSYIVIPRQRSYLDTGTEVSVGDRNFQNYMLPPGGDPGRQNWFYGPDLQGRGSYPLPGPFSIPGYNPDTPF
jgi:hypothetical protein